MNSVVDELRESLRTGWLFGSHDEPLDDAGRRVIRVILTELEHPWQPMATAPKDRPILILADDDERFVACWRNGAWELFGANARIAPTRAWTHLPEAPVGGRF
jgi:hypothetical protein